MDVRPLSHALGAEVAGFDARTSPSTEEVRALQRAYAEHHLLLLRDQVLSAPDQERFVSLFGPLIDDLADGRVSGFISNVMDEKAGDGPLPFHADYSFTAHPVHGIALYAIELPPGGTSTWFANGARAAATLPADLRAAVARRTATHSLGVFATGDPGARSRDHVLPDDVPRHDHPVLRTHPRTGEPVLFITDLHVERVNGVDEAASEALIASLLGHLYAPENVYEHRWQVGDLVVWDNEALQHSRTDVSQAKPRTFRRNSLNDARWIELVGSHMSEPVARCGRPRRESA
jgi:taurine dioxygenase